MGSERPEQQIALVTGASRGLGAEVALGLAVRNVHVVAVARTSGALEALDDRIRDSGGTATLVPLDLTDHEGLQRLSDEIRARFGRLDILVHAAADSLPFTPIRDIDPEGFLRLWRINVDTARAMIASFEPLLAQSGGRAGFVCDRNVAGAYRSAYAATQNALRTIIEAWKSECPAVGIVLVDPPPMATALRKRGFPGENPDDLTNPAEIAANLVQNLLVRTADNS